MNRLPHSSDAHRPRLRYADVSAAGLIIALSLLLLWRVWLSGAEAFLAQGLTYVLYSAVLSWGLYFLLRRNRVSTAVRAFTYALALSTCMSSVRRLTAKDSFYHYQRDNAFALSELTEEERGLWTLRLAAHALHGARLPPRNGQLRIPAQWPLPPGVEIALQPGEGAMMVFARSSGGKLICSWELRFESSSHGAPACSERTAGASALQFLQVERELMPAPDSARAMNDTVGSWTQYRADDTKRGRGEGSATGQDWVASMLAGSRASPSVSGGLVLIGTHGTGSIEAFTARDGAPRWRSILPNWVHQDVVSDGRIAVVGFGDNASSFLGRAPSGVAALDAADGRLRWTAFEHSSVMTSPVITGGRVIYITSLGVIRARRILDGKSIASAQLPGAAIMGPPSLRGDTIVASLDPGIVCAIHATDLRMLWCVKIDDMRLLGHSSPSLAGDTIILSGNAVPSWSTYRRNFTRLSWRQRLQWPGTWLIPERRGDYDAQRVIAMALGTGEILWESDDYFRVHLTEGHISGAATIDSSTIAIGLPIPDTLLVYDRGSLTPRWAARLGGARGPVLMDSGRLYVLSHGGNLRIYAEGTGALQCVINLRQTYDRAGPALGFGDLFVASTDGELRGISKSVADRCQR